MIKNDRQYKITQTEARRFRASADELRDQGSDDLLDRVQLAALESQLETLEAQIREYDELRSGSVDVLTVQSFEDLPLALIRARIAAGLTQRDLGGAIGVKEQQIQRYEANDYAGVSFARLQHIAEALGVTVDNTLFMPSPAGRKASLRRRLRDGGLDDKFIVRRLQPVRELDDSTALADLLGNVSRVFGFDQEDLWSDRELYPQQELAEASGFKRPSGENVSRSRTYAMYARHLALLCIRATPDMVSSSIPTDWKEFRNSVAQSYGEVNFAAILSFVWDKGVIVLPLPDPGGFHGAFWRIDGRDVLVVKQGARSRSRWTFDLLHECYHAAKASDPNAALLDEDGVTDELEDEEQDANQFAGQVALDGRAEELAHLAVQQAKGNLQWLKRAVIDVSGGNAERQEHLANYLAWRLSLQGENWWGTAASLVAPTHADAFDRARAEFFSRMDLNCLDPVERRLLENAFVEL